MQETGTVGFHSPDYGTAFAELDLALIDALQADARAPWSRIGPALGVDATTAARRWDRLVERGLAWTTAYASPGTATVAYVEMRCKAGALDRLTAMLADLPWVFSIEQVAADYDLLLSVCAADPPALARLVRSLGALRGVRSARARLALRSYLDGSRWHIRALAPDRIAALMDHAPSQPVPFPADPRRHPSNYDETDLALLLALGDDGRASFAQLTERTGFGESTIRRRVTRQLRDGDLTLRCDLAQPLSGWPLVLGYRAVVPHAALDRTGTAISRLPQTRSCASVTGSCNLLFSVWLRGTADIPTFESLLVERTPDLHVQERIVTLYTSKRMGRVLDEQGRALRHVPLMIPLDERGR